MDVNLAHFVLGLLCSQYFLSNILFLIFCFLVGGGVTIFGGVMILSPFVVFLIECSINFAHCSIFRASSDGNSLLVLECCSCVSFGCFVCVDIVCLLIIMDINPCPCGIGIILYDLDVEEWIDPSNSVLLRFGRKTFYLSYENGNDGHRWVCNIKSNVVSWLSAI